VHQDLIDDDLSKQRRSEPEQLDDERRCKNFPEYLAVFPDRRDEPGEVEGSTRVVEPQARFDQQQFPDQIASISC